MSNTILKGIVSNVNRGQFKILDLENKEIVSNATFISSESIYPVVGDKVEYYYDNNTPIIFSVNPRKNQLSRVTKDMTKFSKADNIEIFCSNLDYLFIFSSLNEEFNISNIEKFITMAQLSKVTPVIVLTKLDLCTEEKAEKFINECKEKFLNIDVIPISTVNNINLEKLNPYFKKDNTIALLGTSGVGKSTFMNHIVGLNVKTNGVDKNDNGRHTTTTRNLYLTKDGTIIIDMPGIKTINTSNSISRSYIQELSLLCKNKNCTHTVESGCELIKALKNKVISKEELKDFREANFKENKHSKTKSEKYYDNKNKRKNVKALRKSMKIYNDDYELNN